jgi:hypothetical protein
MPSSDPHIDANGAAGMLQEVFLAEVTSAQRICQSCGARRPLGAHTAYAGAGTVLRCPECGDLAATLTATPSERVFELRGTWVFSA